MDLSITIKNIPQEFIDQIWKQTIKDLKEMDINEELTNKIVFDYKDIMSVSPDWMINIFGYCVTMHMLKNDFLTDKN